VTATLPARAPATVGCPHRPPCPPADAFDHDAARIVWHDDNLNASRLCNGIWLFTDGGELIPDTTGPCGCHIDPAHSTSTCREA
jgi:hypothetical protein